VGLTTRPSRGELVQLLQKRSTIHHRREARYVPRHLALYLTRLLYRVGLRFRLVLEMRTAGLIGSRFTSTQVADANCPIQLPMNAAFERFRHAPLLLAGHVVIVTLYASQMFLQCRPPPHTFFSDTQTHLFITYSPHLHFIISYRSLSPFLRHPGRLCTQIRLLTDIYIISDYLRHIFRYTILDHPELQASPV